MSETMNREQLKDLIAQATKAPEMLHTAVRSYLEGLVREAGGELTPEVLREADWLYDVPGISYTIADALGMSLHELRAALGRQRRITCEDCGQEFTVLELRCKGGYTESKKTRCPQCRRKRW